MPPAENFHEKFIFFSSYIFKSKIVYLAKQPTLYVVLHTLQQPTKRKVLNWYVSSAVAAVSHSFGSIRRYIYLLVH